MYFILKIRSFSLIFYNYLKITNDTKMPQICLKIILPHDNEAWNDDNMLVRLYTLRAFS